MLLEQWLRYILHFLQIQVCLLLLGYKIVMKILIASKLSSEISFSSEDLVCSSVTISFPLTASSLVTKSCTINEQRKNANEPKNMNLNLFLQIFPVVFFFRFVIGSLDTILNFKYSHLCASCSPIFSYFLSCWRYRFFYQRNYYT